MAVGASNYLQLKSAAAKTMIMKAIIIAFPIPIPDLEGSICGLSTDTIGQFTFGVLRLRLAVQGRIREARPRYSDCRPNAPLAHVHGRAATANARAEARLADVDPDTGHDFDRLAKPKAHLNLPFPFCLF